MFRFRSLYSRLVLLALFAMVAAPGLQAQIFPSFGPATEQTQVIMDQGMSSLQVPNGLDTNPLVAVYSYQNELSYAVIPDGLHAEWQYNSIYMPGVDCYHLSTCSAAIAMYNGVIYIAYGDESGTGLNVVTATVIPNQVGYTLQLVHTDTTVTLTTSPAMVVYNGALHIIFGASNDPNTSNAFYDATLTGSTWATATETNLGGSSLHVSSGVQPGLAILNGTLFMCSQVNNSSHDMNVYTSTNGTTWSFVELTSLKPNQGLTMIENNGSLIIATLQNTDNQALTVISSPNGTTWTYQAYSGLRIGATLGFTLFNGDYSIAYKSPDASQNWLFTDLASD